MTLSTSGSQKSDIIRWITSVICIAYAIIFSLVLVFGSFIDRIETWLWALPVILFAGVFIAHRWNYIGGALLIVSGILIIIWDSVTGNFGLPYFHLIITLGGITYIFLWYRGRRHARSSTG